MKRATVSAVFLLLLWCLHASSEPLRFKKVTDHCYYLQLTPGGENFAAVVTDEGVLVIDPPQQPDLSSAAEALAKLTPKPVRWVVFSNPNSAISPGTRYFVDKGAVLLAGAQLRSLAESVPGAAPKAAGSSGDLSSLPWLIFEREIRLYPSNLEIRVMAVQPRSRTGADVVVYIPAEKVLFVGGLFEIARYPDIDTAARGDARGWVDGLKQVVESIPLLKPAITQIKPDPNQPDKTLEEGIAVVSARGEVSSLQNMKELLSAVQKLRADFTKAVKSGRSCDAILNSTRAATFRVYSNFEAYAGRLCEELRD